MAGQLTQSEFELRMGEAPLPRGPSLEDLREEALAAARAWAGNSDEVSDADYERALGFHTEFRASLDKAEDLKMKTAAARLKKAAADLQKAVNGSRSRILSKLADAQNGAYLADDEEALTTVVGIVGKANEYTTKLVEGQKAAHEAAAELANMVGKGVKCPTAVKYLGVFQALNYAKQAYDGLQAAISVASTGATGYSEAVAGIKATAGLAGVGGSILEATTGMKLATTPFFGEMLNAALKALNQAFKVSKAVALDAIKRGDYDVVDWNHFPGGRAMFDYMRAVMRAGGPGDIPQPVPQSISDYLVGRESEITAGLGGSEQAKEMPTEELLFWEEVDPKRISEWVFRYRQSLWAMFYGSLDAASLP